MISCTLVAGGSAAARQAAIAALLEPTVSTAVILEGIHPDEPALHDPARPASLFLSTIAADCPCCGAGLVLRVTLDRMVQRRPARLYISLADAAHLSHLQQFLNAPPYAGLLTLTAPILL